MVRLREGVVGGPAGPIRRRPRPAGARRTGTGRRVPQGPPGNLGAPPWPPLPEFSRSRRPIATPQTPTGDRGAETGQDDRELARRAVAGDRDAREELATRLRCVPRFVAERNRRLGSPLSVEGVEEVSQNVVLEVWQRLDRFEGRARLETWTYVFCRNETMNAVRRMQRERSRTQGLSGPDGDVDPAVTMTVDHGLVDEETEALLGRLAPRETEVLRLRHFEDLALPEIALRLGLSVSSVKTHYYRGLTKLREFLDPGAGEVPR